MAELIRVDGVVENVFPNNGTDFSLKELQTLVKGSIECIHLADGRTMIIDEEGKFKDNHRRNNIASFLLEQAGGIPGDYIAGDALVCSSKEIK